MSLFSGMRLSHIDTAQKMTINHPATGLPLYDKNGNESFVSVLSSDSAVSKKFDQQVLDRRMNRKAKPTGADMQEEMLMKSALLISPPGASWHIVNPETLEPIDVACTEVNARMLLREAEWILEQVSEFSRERSHFMKG